MQSNSEFMQFLQFYSNIENARFVPTYFMISFHYIIGMIVVQSQTRLYTETSIQCQRLTFNNVIDSKRSELKVTLQFRFLFLSKNFEAMKVRFTRLSTKIL